MNDIKDLNNFIPIFMEEAKDTLEQWERTCLEIEKNPSNESFTILFRFAHNLKGSSSSVNLDTFATFIHKIEDIISLLRDGKCDYNPEYVALFLKCHTVMEQWCEQLQFNLKFIPKEITEIENYIAQLNIQKKDNTKEIPSEGNEFGIFSDISNSENEKKPTADDSKNIKKLNKPEKNQETIRVLSSKIDIIMHYISELCTHQAIISHCSSSGKYESKSFKNSIHICEKIIKELQSNVFSLRMLPLNSLFQRLERAAKSLAMEQNKDIIIITEGTHVELDKNLIEKFLDPLVHVIRNAVDHGIESSEERVSKNKPIKSTIRICAHQNITHVTIIISDDGKGINTKSILKKAIQKNLISENELLTEQEIYQLLFQPGFSTAEKVTEVSGRGVGLDVVRQVLNEIGGYMNIESQIDKGTSFEFHLPTNLSIIDVLTVKIAKLNYVIPISEINEVLDLSKFHFDKVTNSEKITIIRKTPVIIKNLGYYLNSHTETELNENIYKKIALLTETNNTLYAFEIDELIGIESVVFRKKSDKLLQIKYFTGSAVLPNGEPAFILSLKELIHQMIVPKENHKKTDIKECEN